MKTMILVLSLACMPVSANPWQISSNTKVTEWEVPAAIITDAPVSDFLIPVAVNAPGGGGTFFRTDLTLINYKATEQRILIHWIARGGAGATTRGITVGPNAFVTYPNVGETLFGVTGLGYISGSALDANFQLDATAQVDAMSRIWTPQPGTSGTTSQALGSVRLGYIRGDQSATMLGLRQDAGFRTNVGIVNLDSVPHVFNVFVAGTNGTTQFQITVPRLSMEQQALPAGNYGYLVIGVRPADNFPREGNLGWHAYASSVDNFTGDAWVVNGAP